jgi:hypothetical protein
VSERVRAESGGRLRGRKKDMQLNEGERAEVKGERRVKKYNEKEGKERSEENRQ